MQKFLSCLAVLALLLCASLAYAGTYGPADAKFKVTPAPGWTEAPADGGVQLTNGKSALVIVVAPHGGLTLEALGAAVITQLGLTDVTKESSDDMHTIVGKKDSTELKMIFVKLDDGKNVASFTMSGPDTADMEKMVDSLEDVK